MQAVINGKEYINKEDYKNQLIKEINENRKDFEKDDRIHDGFDILERIISNS